MKFNRIIDRSLEYTNVNNEYIDYIGPYTNTDSSSNSSNDINIDDISNNNSI